MTDDRLFLLAGVGFAGLVLFAGAVRQFNKLKTLYNEVRALDADINTALGHRRDLLLRARVIAKDFQDHELRMKALRPDSSILINTPQVGAGPPPLPMVATSSPGTKADDSQHKVQLDINAVEAHLRAKIEQQHLAVKAYNNWRDRFPNFLFARLVRARDVEYYRYKDEESLFTVQDIYAEDRDLHRTIVSSAMANHGALPPPPV
jgi:hypothetical protein